VSDVFKAKFKLRLHYLGIVSVPICPTISNTDVTTHRRAPHPNVVCHVM
jgi:hypothetical protein